MCEVFHTLQPYLTLKQVPSFQKLLCVLCLQGQRGRAWGREKKETAGDGEVGKEGRAVGITMPKWDSFSIFVFLKKYRLYYQEEEACAGMVPGIPRWMWVRSKPKRRHRVEPGDEFQNRSHTTV